MTHVPNHGHQGAAAAFDSILDRLRQLADALDLHDQATADRRSALGAGSATLTGAVRRAVRAASLLLEAQDVLAGALHDAVEYRGGEPDWCRDCEQAEEGNLCPDHTQDAATADAYNALRRALFGDGYGIC